MKTNIIYMSNNGCTESVSKELAEKLNGEVKLSNLKEVKNPDIENYDRIIIGGSIHTGKIQNKLHKFCENKIEKLAKKEVGLFICCMYEGDQAFKQLNEAFPEKLHQYSKAEAILGGKFDFDKMNTFEKVVVKKIAKVDSSVNNINHQAIEKFAKRMDKTFSPFLMLI